MADDLPVSVTDAEDYPIRKRVGGLALVSLFFYEGRHSDVALVEQFEFADLLVEGVLLGLAAVVVGLAVAASGYVTD